MFENLAQGTTSYNLVAYAAGTTRATFAINGNVTVTSGLTNVAAVLLPEGNPTGSNLSFAWTFNGGTSPCTSGQLGEGVQVSVTSDAGFSSNFACSATGTAGAYALGSYAYQISALGNDGGVAYAASGVATVNGITDTTILADLPPAAGGIAEPGNLIATMTFSGQSCVGAGVDTLHFSLRDSTGAVVGGGNNDSSTPCLSSDGTLGGSHYFSGITAGTYWLEVTGLSTSGATATALDYFTGQVTVSPNYTALASADASAAP
jgi:hypothetical protein